MWSFSSIVGQTLRPAVTALAATIVALALANCTLTPVYGTPGASGTHLDLTYAEPGSRLEQIVYQDLRAAFGPDAGMTSPQVSVAIASSSSRLHSTATADPKTVYQVTLTATIKVTGPANEAKALFTGTRKAAAQYTVNAQALADRQARTDAEQRAAHSLAQTIRLTLIAALTGDTVGQ